jgi:uncharacterized protein YjbI with pentapeptide repeats
MSKTPKVITTADDLSSASKDERIAFLASDGTIDKVALWNAWARKQPAYPRINLRGADLTGADLTGADLTGADLRGAYLTGAYLRGAYLTGAYLRGADLTGAYLTGAYLRGAYLTGADLTGADLTGAYLRGAYLTGAYLRGADLTGAYLRGAYLRGAYLRGADLTGADLRGADLTGAYLTGADLTGAKINWNSHQMLAEILLRAADEDVERRKIAGLILVSLDWCWEKFTSVLSKSERAWVASVLVGYVVDGDDAPAKLKRYARLKAAALDN